MVGVRLQVGEATTGVNKKLGVNNLISLSLEFESGFWASNLASM